MEIELNRYEREKRPFGILLIDIDDFKKINDEHGHLEGDQVLTELSSLIKTHIREIDFIGRWGGEEFIIVVSNTSSEALTLFAKKLNSLVNLHPFESGYRVTISIGAALIREQDNDHTLLDRADEALYRAKNAGKNQVCFESE
jgi:diguanylate cyclase (GGDEF)-like protein